MKNNILKTLLPGLCGIMALQPSFANDIFHPFIGANLGVSVNSYDTNVGKKYGVPFSTFGSADYMALTYGANAGIRFLDNSRIYHPGINLFFEQIEDYVELKVATEYGVTINAGGDSVHTLFGGEFDNYIRVAHNDTLFVGGKTDTFLIFGIDIGKIKSKYELLGENLSEDGTFFGGKIEALIESDNGIGFNISCRLLGTTGMEAISSIFSTRLGVRYTF